MPSSVLVTGATGFIGRAVVRRLLAAGQPVLAVARGREGQAAAARVAAAVGIAPDGRWFDVVEADLTRPRCAVQESEWRRLCDAVETVIHCAGDTTFFPEDIVSFRASHIDGPLHLLHQLRDGRLRRWAHLSTAYVCGRRTGVVYERESEIGQDFHNPYERVKLEAELALRRAGARLGVDVRVFRPSIVVGATSGTAGGNPSKLFFSFIRMVAALSQIANGKAVPLRIEAAPRARFNIVSVEYVATAAVALTVHPDATGGTFHVVVSDPPTQEDMLAMITQRLGLRGLSLVDLRHAHLEDPSRLEVKIARMLSGYRQYLKQDLRFDDRAARALLDRCGVERPTISRETVHRLIDAAVAPFGPVVAGVTLSPFGAEGARPVVPCPAAHARHRPQV